MINIQSYQSIRNEIKKIILLGIPLIASQIIYACSGFIGTAMVAQLGENALAASVLVSTSWITLSVFFFGVLNAVNILVAHQYGAKNNKAISEIMGQAYMIGIAICLPLFLLLSLLPTILRLSNQPVEVIYLAIQYLHSLLWTIPGLITLVISEHFLKGLGHGKLVLIFSVLVVPIEIPLIYALIFGKAGLPMCGLAGVGYGFAITYALTGLFLILILLKSKTYKKYEIFRELFHFNPSHLKEIFKIGLPIGLTNLVEVSTFAFITIWIGRFGTTTLAAHQIVMQYLTITITIIFAMSQAVSIRVGHAVGSKNMSGIWYAIYVGMGLNFLIMLIFAVAFYSVPQFFLQLDIDVTLLSNQDLVQRASSLLAIAGVLLLFDNCRIIGFGALRGLKDTRFTMYVSLLGFWLLGLCMAFLLGFTFHFGAAGIWWGLTSGIASGAVLILARLRYLLHKIVLESKLNIV